MEEEGDMEKRRWKALKGDLPPMTRVRISDGVSGPLRPLLNRLRRHLARVGVEPLSNSGDHYCWMPTLVEFNASADDL